MMSRLFLICETFAQYGMTYLCRVHLQLFSGIGRLLDVHGTGVPAENDLPQRTPTLVAHYIFTFKPVAIPYEIQETRP